MSHAAVNAPIPAAVSIATRNDRCWKPHRGGPWNAASKTLPTQIAIAIAILVGRHGTATGASSAVRDRRSLSARSTAAGIGSSTLGAALGHRRAARPDTERSCPDDERLGAG